MFFPITPALVQTATSYTKWDVQIPMRDGKKLYTVIYYPKSGNAKHPILMERTPYSVPYKKDDLGPVGGNSPYTREGYILVFQDVRGKFMSEGEYENVRPLSSKPGGIDESTDTYDTIDWLIKHVPHNNGKVGLTGVSYPGFYAAVGAVNAHPALKAVSPQAPVTDWFLGDDDHHNGAFFLLDNFAWAFNSSFDWPRKGPTMQWSSPGLKYDSDNAYDFYLKLGPLKNANERYFKHQVRFWDDLIAHDTYDAFWKARTPLPHFKNLKPAFLVVTGWFDAEDLWGPQHMIRTLTAQSPKTPAYFVSGPWSHGGWGGPGNRLHDMTFGEETGTTFRNTIEFPFFNYYLNGKGAPPAHKAKVYATGSNRWLSFSSWPPANLPQKTYYLQSEKGLSEETPQNAASDSYVSDPANPVPYMDTKGIGRNSNYVLADQRFASARPDVLSYTAAPLTADMTVVGPIEVELTVATTGTDSDWVVKVIDVSPDGYQRLIRGDIFRGKFRNSFEKPEPFVPGQPTKVRFTLGDTCHTFLKDHRLQVQVQSSWFPIADRNPHQFMNIGKATETDFQKATQTVYHSTQYPSWIRFGTVK